MFGSKSSALYDELIRRHYGGQKSLMVKKTSDTRYDQYKIETHDHKYSNVIKIENKGKINVYELNKEINPLRKEVVLCKDIIERSKKMEQNLQELSDEKEKTKEVEKNEHIR